VDLQTDKFRPPFVALFGSGGFCVSPFFTSSIGRVRASPPLVNSGDAPNRWTG
jgi:hypothetical protein